MSWICKRMCEKKNWIINQEEGTAVGESVVLK
jgi:hypothetical protein